MLPFGAVSWQWVNCGVQKQMCTSFWSMRERERGRNIIITSSINAVEISALVFTCWITLMNYIFSNIYIKTLLHKNCYFKGIVTTNWDFITSVSNFSKKTSRRQINSDLGLIKVTFNGCLNVIFQKVFLIWQRHIWTHILIYWAFFIYIYIFLLNSYSSVIIRLN